MLGKHRYPAWLLALSATQAGALLVFLNFAGALPLLQADWGFSNAQAGAIQAAGQMGYVFSVLVIASLSDYVDAKQLIVGGALWAGLSNLAFAAFATDTQSAILLRALLGMGIAGIYMPGMKLISHHIPAATRGSALGLFVSAFTLGTAASIAISGNLASLLGWRPAFALTSIGPILGALLAARVLPAGSSLPLDPAATAAPPLAGLLRNRVAWLVVLIYMSHAWEVLGLRNWMAAYLAAVRVAAGSSLAVATSSGATVSGITTLFAAGATYSVATLSDHVSRSRTIIIVMGLGLAATLFLGFSLPLPWALVVAASLAAAFLANADSAVISTTLTEEIPPAYLGRVLAVYSFLGFTAGSVSSLVFGAALDYASPRLSPEGGAWLTPWSWAFATLALGSMAGFFLALGLQRALAARHRAQPGDPQ